MSLVRNVEPGRARQQPKESRQIDGIRPWIPAFAGMTRGRWSAELDPPQEFSIPDFIGFMKEQKSLGRSWAEISSLVLERYGISLTREQVKSLLRA